MHAQKLPGRGLTAHYFFTFGVEVQLVGDRKNTRVEQRILHLDVAAPAIKLIQKGSVRVFLRFDGINQIVFDDVEPRSVLISCRDDRRFFIVFQSAEDNLVFRTACSDLAAGSLDVNRFQRAVLKKGQLMKRGKAGALFGDRYAILTPRKLFIMPSKVSVFPSNAISLEEATPRFDDNKGTIHLDVCGKEYVFQGSDKEESQDWFVEVARAATSKVPIVLWENAAAAWMQAEAAATAADEQHQGDDDDDEEGVLDLAGHSYAGGGGGGGGFSSAGNSPSHFTSPDDWEEDEETPDTHLDITQSNSHNHPGRNMARHPAGSPPPRSRSLQGGSRGGGAGQQRQAFSSWSGGGEGAGRSGPGGSTGGGIGRGVPGSFSGSGASYVDPSGNVINLGPGVTRSLVQNHSSSGGSSSPGSLGGSRGLRRSWSGASSGRSGPGSPVQQQQQQQRPPSAAGSIGGRNMLGTIYESGESDLNSSVQQTHSSPSVTEDTDVDAAASSEESRQQQQQRPRPPPPAPPLRLQPRQQLPAAAAVGGRQGGSKPAAGPQAAAAAAAATAAAQAARARAGTRRQQEQQHSEIQAATAAGFFVNLDEEGYQQQQDEDQETEAAQAVPVSDGDGVADGSGNEVQEYDGEVGLAAQQQQQQQSRGIGTTQLSAGPSPYHRQQAAAAAATARSKQGLRATNAAKAHDLTGTGGFMSPGSEVDLEALTDAVAARVEAAQQAKALRNSQISTTQQQCAGSAGAAAAAGYQSSHSPLLHGQYLSSLQAAGAMRCQPGSPALPSVGQYDVYATGQQQQQQQWPGSRYSSAALPASYHCSPASTAAPGGWRSTVASQLNTHHTINISSSPGVISTSGAGAKAPGLDSTNGWGRKSLAGLYSSRTQTTSSHSPAHAVLGTNHSSASAGLTATAGRVSFATGPLRGRLSGHGGAGAGAGGVSCSGVVLGEYIIPSVFRVIVHCPEGEELAQQLTAKSDLTPHQRCLALMRWAFGVYNQLPDDARTAVPLGPSRHNLNTWVTPDMNLLTQTIQQAQQQQQQTLWQHQQQAAAQLLQQISTHVCRTNAAAAAGPLHAVEGAAATAAVALLSSLVQAASGALAPAGMLSNPVLQPGLLGLLGPAVTLGPQYMALQQLLTAAAAGKDIPTMLQEFTQAQLRGSNCDSAQHAVKPRSRSASPHCRRHKQKTAELVTHDEVPVSQKCRCRSSSPLSCKRREQQQQQQQHGLHPCTDRHAAVSFTSSTDDEETEILPSSNRRSSNSGSCSSSESSATCSSRDRDIDHMQHNSHCSRMSTSSPSRVPCHNTMAPNSAGAGADGVMHPNMKVTVRLKRHHLIPAGHCTGAREGINRSGGHAVEFGKNHHNSAICGGGSLVASPGGHRSKGHRLRGHCSFTCDNPLFQLNLAAADPVAAADDPVAAVAAACKGGYQSKRPVSAGTVLDCFSGTVGGSTNSQPVRCSAVCHLSPAAAQTICQAASTAAAAAAAAVRSAVLTIDGDDLSAAAMKHPSIQSLVGRVQAGNLDASDFVGTVAAGRAGALLRAQYD